MELATEAPKSPEEIFPLEVWGLILDNLVDASDLKSCYHTCNGWAELLKPKRTTFLMPEVFPILHKYEYDYPQLYLSPYELLPMRLVSKPWKESLDTFYQHHPSINLIGCLERPCPIYEQFPLNQYEFHVERNGLAKLERFLAKDFPLDSNPFIARYIHYHDNVRSADLEVPPQRDFPITFTRLLESFGTQIWNCTLHFGWVTVNRTGVYTVLRHYLSLLPNLRSLTVTVNDHQCFEAFEMGIASLLPNQPFPELNYLTELEMNSVPYPLSVGLLAPNTQVRTLSISNMYPHEAEGILTDHVVNVHSENMEHLLVRACRTTDLVRFQKVTWPLKVLELGMNRCCDAKLSDVFQAVSTFSNTLEKLFIRYSCNSKEDNKKLQEQRLRLQNLKNFKLTTPFVLKTIDFFVECRDLQEIELFIGMSKEKDTIPTFGDEEDVNVADSLEDREEAVAAVFSGDDEDVTVADSVGDGETANNSCEHHGETPNSLGYQVGDNSVDSSDAEKVGDAADSSDDEEVWDATDFIRSEETGDVVDSFGDEDASASDIQFYKCMTSMQVSNIWEVLPVLGFITIKTTSRSEIDPEDLSESVHRFTWSQNAKYIQKLHADQMETASSTNKTPTS